MRRSMWQIELRRRVSFRPARGALRGAAVLIVVSLLFLLAAHVFAGPHSVRADQVMARVKRMTVSILPEYDEPGVLAIYEGEIENAHALPSEVRFRVPMGADVRQACAVRLSNGEHLCQPFETHPVDDDLLVTYRVPLPTFFLQFYFADTAGARDLRFAFRPESPVEELELLVQHPLRASDFSLLPTGSLATRDDQGFLYHRFRHRDVAPAQPLEVTIAYHKDDQQPSVPKKTASVVPAPLDGERKGLILLGTGVLLTAALVTVIYLLMDRLGTGSIVVVRSVRSRENVEKTPDEPMGESSRPPIDSRG